MVLENNPPFIVHSRRHPLYDSLKEALNHHRTKRTDMKALQNLVKNVVVPDTKSLFQSCKTKPVTPKVAGLFGSRAEKGVDDVLDFINIPTQQSLNFMTNSVALYPFLALPSVDLLAIYHQLKEELLRQIGQYDSAWAAHHFTDALAQVVDHKPRDKQGFDGILGLHSFIFKAVAETAKQTAQLLGATCLLLRIQGASKQTSHSAKETLIYTSDIVGTAILTIRDAQGIDQTLLSNLMKINTATSGHSSFRRHFGDSNRSQQNQNRNNQDSRGQQPFRGNQRGHSSNSYRGNNSGGRGATNHRGGYSSGQRGGGGRGSYNQRQDNRSFHGQDQRPRQNQDRYRSTNEGNRAPTRPSRPPTSRRN